MLSTAYASAVAFLNRRLPPEQHITYVAWDLRQRSRTLGASLLADLQKDQAPLLAASGIFAASPVQVQQTQHGVVRTNCVDCLDRTNVAQFAFGLLALGEQLRALGIVSHAGVDLRSSLAGEVMQAWESTGNTLSEQYAGSEAHTGVFQKWRGDWQAARQSRNFLTSIRRFYSNVVTDEDKQHAINLFVGAFIPPAEKSSSRRPSSSGSEREDLAAAGSSSSAMNARLGGVDIDHQTSMSPDAMGPLVATLSSVSLASSACEALVEPTLDQLLTEAAAAAAAHGPSAEVVLAASSSTTSGAQSPEMTPGSRVRSPVGRKPRWVQRAVAAVTPALVSLQHVLPTDVRPVRLVAPRPMSPPSVPWLSPRRPQSSDGAEETRCGDKASAEVPLPPRPPARLVRSNSAGDAADLAAAAASWRSGGGGPTGGGSGGSPALGPSSSTDLIQSLNLEGTNLPPTAGGAGVGKPPGPTPTGGLGGQGKRVSFASFANLRQLVMGGASGASAPGSRAPSRVSSLAGDLATSGESSLGNSVVPSLAGGGQGTRARSERRLVPMPMESMLLQHQAVAHGIDQLGLPGAMAALWLRPNDAMNALAVAEASMASGESVTARAVVPLTPADHAALEKATVAQLQPPFSINAAAF